MSAGVKKMDMIDLEQKQREEARWRILRVLDAGRPISVSETIIWRPALTSSNIRPPRPPESPVRASTGDRWPIVWLHAQKS
jgi:hypothetical protein